MQKVGKKGSCNKEEKRERVKERSTLNLPRVHLFTSTTLAFKIFGASFIVLNVMLNLKTLLDTEDQCLSILGGVLPKI